MINALIPRPNSSVSPETNPLQSAIDMLIDCGRLTDAKEVLNYEIKEGISNRKLIFYISAYVVRKFFLKKIIVAIVKKFCRMMQQILQILQLTLQKNLTKVD